MSSETRFEFTRENIDSFLKELAKEYRKQAGKAMPAELILIGGASILINYGFRNMTTDIDALIHASSAMKDAIRLVGDRFSLPSDWLNADFRQTDSYSAKLPEYSVYYKTWSNTLSVRTISAEYLVAMKLRSGRQYKSDLSDVIGILAEHEKKGMPLRLEQIQKAVSDLYGSWDQLPVSSQVFIQNVFQEGHFEQLYSQIVKDENDTRALLIQFEQDYPNILKQENAGRITEKLQQKTDRASLLASLREKQREETRQNPRNAKRQPRDDAR
ncbi:MAG: hypothetical protein J5493_02985 [Lachnospiraceae bacterium]|nr:hypothetical protein [Lachnospiraceae bacterium]